MAAIVLFCLALLVCIVLGTNILYALLAGLVIFTLYGKKQGFSWKELGKMICSGVKTSASVLLVFPLIGILTAFWRACGTLPFITTKELILCALFIALVTVGTFIKIPVGTDVYTLQFLFTLLAGLLLGPRLGAIAVGTYVVMGLVGIPVFASGGGPGYIAQPTFGYLLGFIVQAWVNGSIARKLKTINFRSLLEANLVGMAVVYLFGLEWFYVVSNYVINAPISVWAVIWYCGILQVIPDVILCIGAALIGVRGYKAGIWLERK